MKRNLQWGLLFGLLILVAAVILAARDFRIRSAMPAKNANNNPQDFLVRATNSSFSYCFRYDPRAADEWLFHSGAGLISTSIPPQAVTNLANERGP